VRTGESDWPRERVEAVAASICDPSQIEALLAAGRKVSAAGVRDILYQARTMQGLSPGETAALIQVTDPALRAEITAAARYVHEQVYGRRLGIFAPVCPTNRCVDDCAYCPLRRSNTQLRRTMSRPRDVQREVKDLLEEGHCRLIMVFGNDRSGLPFIRDMVEAASSAAQGNRRIQRIDLNLDPQPMADLRRLKHPAIGIYHVFQETYDPKQYALLHPSGPKSDYAARLTCHDQAIEAGLGEVGRHEGSADEIVEHLDEIIAAASAGLEWARQPWPELQHDERGMAIKTSTANTSP